MSSSPGKRVCYAARRAGEQDSTTCRASTGSGERGEPLTIMLTICLLVLSNVFMTFAWYGHLKFKSSPLWIAILVSWGIAFVEYCFQVPANRYGHGTFSAPQLKMMQEVITLLVFAVFSIWFLGEKLRWNDIVGFTLIVAAVFCVFVLNPRSGAAG